MLDKIITKAKQDPPTPKLWKIRITKQILFQDLFLKFILIFKQPKIAVPRIVLQRRVFALVQA